MDYTWGQILAALGGAVGVVTALLGIAQFIYGRFDIKVGRKERTLDKQLNDSVDLQKIELEKHLASDALFLQIIALKDGEIITLKADVIDAKQANQLSRPTATNIYSKLREMEKIITQLENAIEDVLRGDTEAVLTRLHSLKNRYPAMIKEKLAELRDLLP